MLVSLLVRLTLAGVLKLKVVSLVDKWPTLTRIVSRQKQAPMDRVTVLPRLMRLRLLVWRLC